MSNGSVGERNGGGSVKDEWCWEAEVFWEVDANGWGAIMMDQLGRENGADFGREEWVTEESFEGASEAVQEELIGGEDVLGAVIGDCGGEQQRSE